MQVFDYHNGYMPSSLVQENGRRFDAVWASLSPREWDAAHPGMTVSEYYIMGLDQVAVTHRTLSWWKAKHPDWIFYACTASGAPTHDIAYMPGVANADMPIDIENSAAVADEVNTMAGYAKAAGYNALAVDQVVFWNIYHGGNAAFGQKRNTSEYGCGSWHGNTFVRRYSSPQDPRWTADVIAYTRVAHAILHSRGMVLLVNHPAGNINSPNEQQLVVNTDELLNETGFSDYGRYTQKLGLMVETLAWSRYAQQHGVAVFTVNKFINIPSSVTGIPLEYSIATYLLANQGAELLYTGGLHGYGTQQIHPEYSAPIGTPCSDVGDGPTVFFRRFTGGLVVVTASSSGSFTLPAGKGYRDLIGRPVSSTLHLGPTSAYVLLAAVKGCS